LCVEIKGAKTLQRSCVTEIAEGMEIKTASVLLCDVEK
jgi:predicted molibdopterin-dependent oxidoreductase YjgC